MIHPVVEYLRTHSVASLEEFGIFARYSAQNPEKFSLNYDQIKAIDGHHLVNLCRGLVLRNPRTVTGDYEVLARPMYRFYNFGTNHAAAIDWSTAVFEEKLDGTCCIVYFDSDLDRWCVATRSIPDADVPCPNGKTFSEMFWEHTDFTRDSRMMTNYTFIYELCGPDNQIVVPYNEWRTVQLCYINNVTGEEQTYRVFSPNVVKTYSFQDIEGATRWLNQQPGHELEGFVIRDAAGNRIKLKSSAYLAISKVMTSVGSEFGLMSIALNGTADDMATFLPKEKLNKIQNYRNRFVILAAKLEDLAKSISTNSSRKDAALLIQDSEFATWIGVVLSIWTKKYHSVYDWLEQQKNNKTNPGAIPSTVIEKILSECGE